MKKILVLSLAVALFAIPFGSAKAQITKQELAQTLPQLSQALIGLNSVLSVKQSQNVQLAQTLPQMTMAFNSLSSLVGQASTTLTSSHIGAISGTVQAMASTTSIIISRETTFRSAVGGILTSLQSITNTLSSAAAAM